MSDSRDSSASPRAPASLPLYGIQQGELVAGKYRAERVIGRGGMGVVVAATHLQLGRTVAIKLLREEFVEDPSIVERLVREARAAASIQSEHVARVLDVGTLDNGAPFIVMEYLDGQDLDSLLHSDGPLQVPEAVDFMLQACEAIAEAHFNHIVHRDLKPANLFVARQPGGVRCVKVVDFGISKLMDLEGAESLTDPSRMMGSLYHMAPEQISGQPVDARTDVWALGVLLYEMLTGQKPFRPGAWPAVCHQIISEPPPELEGLGAEIPDELQAAIRRCLRRAPAERYANVAELAVEIMPYGSRRARHSLERIVRLATATGSLSAETLSPATPQVTFRAPLAPSFGVSPAPAAADAAADLEDGALDVSAERSREGSHAPLSSDRRLAPAPARGHRHLWALGLLLGSALVVFVAVRLADSGQIVASESLKPLSPSLAAVPRVEETSDSPPPSLAPAPPGAGSPASDLALGVPGAAENGAAENGAAQNGAAQNGVAAENEAAAAPAAAKPAVTPETPAPVAREPVVRPISGPMVRPISEPAVAPLPAGAATPAAPGKGGPAAPAPRATPPSNTPAAPPAVAAQDPVPPPAPAEGPPATESSPPSTPPRAEPGSRSTLGNPFDLSDLRLPPPRR